MSYHYRGPCIDHGLLSPSGRMSRRARAAAEKREYARLFPPGHFDPPEPTEREKDEARALSLRRSASNLITLSGDRPKNRRQAAAWNAEADALTAKWSKQ